MKSIDDKLSEGKICISIVISPLTSAELNTRQEFKVFRMVYRFE